MIGRLKFDITSLVDEILDQLPSEVWSSSTTRFLDPAMGGGQFVASIENRLRVAGHSDKNISSRVYGYESNLMRINFAVNKYKLVGNYVNKDILHEGGDMKFDVIIGNPPYQNPGKSKGQKLWYKFIFKANNLLKENGYLGMVTPTSWIRGGVNHGKEGVLKDIFGKKQLIVASFRDITKNYFPKIGIEIGWWVMQNKPIVNKTKLILKDAEVYVDLTGIEVMSPVADSRAISILNKFIDDKFAKEKIIYFNYKNLDLNKESAKPTETHTVKHWVHGCSQKNNDHYTYLESRFNDRLNVKKILFLIGSRFWQPHIDEDNVGVIAQGFAIPIQDNWNKDNILSVYESKLWKLIFFNFQLEQNGFMKNAIVRKTPAMDMSRKWTDTEIYNYFGLTTEEIEYIEYNTK